MINLIGRLSEQARLMRRFNSNESEFIALYGRRRVGKTFMVREVFENAGCIYFELIGQKNTPLTTQLSHFSAALQKTFYPKLTIIPPRSWKEAFDLLTDAVRQSDSGKKVVIFLDELPWLASKKSNLIEALDHIWNSEWVKISRLKLIICGSAASWMIRNIISDKGGLHNRTTDIMQLKPFDLAETKVFLEHHGVTLSLPQILQLYMVTGGVPYYLKAIVPGRSAVENIGALCFQDTGLLYSEFDKLFDSLFDQSSIYKELITIIASKRYGIEQNEILSQAKLSTSGGRFKVRLEELEQSGFIKMMQPGEKGRKTKYYRLVDEYSYFYLKWILPAKHQLMMSEPNHYWDLQVQSPAWQAWSGYAFETICFKHINQIIKKLGLSQLVISAQPWRYQAVSSEQQGAQIDLIFKRNDQSITLCEIKYNNKPLQVTKEFRDNMLLKEKIYQRISKTHDHIFLVLITNAGIEKNQYAKEIFSNIVEVADLFSSLS